MEMRASEETEMSRDITPPLAPIAVALHDRFLFSHCSSCFLQIPRSGFPPPCRGCRILHYCSLDCHNSDIDSHTSSGECDFLRNVQSNLANETTDLRAALRLRQSLRNLGFFPPGVELRRIAGLLTGDRERIDDNREFRSLMLGGEDDVEEIELARRVVLTNGVELQIGEGRGNGIGVYGPRFSWFNHSCSPSACFRFELRGSDCFYSKGKHLVFPFSTDPGDDFMMSSWILDEGRLNEGSCRFAPRVIVRSIRPIKNGEQVCISYTDLLQPKALRQSDLWSKYAFICSCPRCNASPESHADRLLSGIRSADGSATSNSHLQETEEQADMLEQITMDYLSGGDPKLCSTEIEQILSNGFKIGNLQPLHHLSLKAYMALASIYRTQAYDRGRGDARAAAVYAFLLAGTTHHLFLSDPSLIVATANFWVDAGESFLSLARLSHADHDTIFQNYLSSLSWDEFRGTSSRFLSCIRGISSKVWPALTVGIQCLGDITNTVDFNWLHESNMAHDYLGVSGFKSKIKCIGCRYEEENGIEDIEVNIIRLTVHCLTYGAYLGSVCYGPCSYWVDRIWSLVNSQISHQWED